MKIKGTVSLVTGGARGLGVVIAEALHEKGSIVEVADRDEAALQALAPPLRGTLCDVSNPQSVTDWIQGVISRHGKIDILVNNAGRIHSEPLINIMNADSMAHDLSAFREVVESNLTTTFVTGSLVAEHMVRVRTRGVIINVSSISAIGNEGQSAYSAAKAGVNALTVTWSKELGRLGIRCNAVAPGFMDTPSTRAALSESVIKYLESVIPGRKLGEAAHVAAGVIGLIENEYLNGVILDINGGLRI